MKTILDIGCGSNPLGTTNIDLFTGYSVHRSGYLNPTDIPNFIQHDVTQGIPFADNSFDMVFSKDTLEHVGRKPQKNNPYPYLVLKEMFRVSKSEVEIYVPHRFSLANTEKRFWRREHNAFFNLKWFERSFRRIEKELNIKISILAEIQYKPLILYFIMMPDEIHIRCFKRCLK